MRTNQLCQLFTHNLLRCIDIFSFLLRLLSLLSLIQSFTYCWADSTWLGICQWNTYKTYFICYRCEFKHAASDWFLYCVNIYTHICKCLGLHTFTLPLLNGLCLRYQPIFFLMIKAVSFLLLFLILFWFFSSSFESF